MKKYLKKQKKELQIINSKSNIKIEFFFVSEYYKWQLQKKY